MFSFKTAHQAIGNSYNGKQLWLTLRALLVKSPLDSTAMYLRGETPEYIYAASLACMQSGE